MIPNVSREAYIILIAQERTEAMAFLRRMSGFVVLIGMMRLQQQRGQARYEWWGDYGRMRKT